MKESIRGSYSAGCSPGFDVWGVACRAPSFQFLGEHNDDDIQEVSYDYKRAAKTYIPAETKTKDILPEYWPFQVDQTWSMYLAKLPGTMPGRGCNNSVISSYADDSFSTEICYAGKHIEDEDIAGQYYLYPNISYFYSTRAIYVDGEQRYISVKTTNTHPDNTTIEQVSDPQGLGATYWWGDHHIVRISDQQKIAHYRVGTLDGHEEFTSPSHGGDGNPNAMESFFIATLAILPNLFDRGIFTPIFTPHQPPCNGISYGLEYCIGSSYKPTASSWNLSRIKYSGQRFNPVSNVFESGIEVFQTQTNVGVSGTASGDYYITLPSTRVYLDSSVEGSDEAWVCAISKQEDETKKIVTGQWFNRLFRTEGATQNDTEEFHYADGTLQESEVANVIIDSSDSQHQANIDYPDENWNNIRIRSYNRIYDPTTSGSKDLLLFTTSDTDLNITATGLIADFEQPTTPTTGIVSSATSGNITLSINTSDVVNFYTNETITITGGFGVGQSRTITYYSGSNRTAIIDTPWTTVPSGGTSEYSITSTYDPNYLDNGLSGIIRFDNGGSRPDNYWLADGTINYTSGGSSYSALTNINAFFEGTTDLSVTFHVLETSQISFVYRLDNRWYGTRIPPFEELTNFADPDNHLSFYVDGALVPCTIDGVSFDTSRVDNVNVPGLFDEESEYLQWREVVIDLTPGTHTVRWSLARNYQDNGHLYAQLDDIVFPGLLAGDDTESAKRWLYNGERVQECNYWAWARRDEENVTQVLSRTRTVPDFITMDLKGDILLGNPHYVAKLKRREDDPTLFEIDHTHGGRRGDGFEDGLTGKGYVRFTASPNADQGTSSCLDDDDRGESVDQISDPPWGAFQILPIVGGYQIRGANAGLRDASVYPINENDYKYKHPVTKKWVKELFKEYLIVRLSAQWSQRPHSWTITDNGKNLRPHVEVIERPTLNAPAWPEDSWPVPPYRTDFPTSDGNQDFAPSSTRPRNSLFLPSGSDRPRWAMNNWIISTTYSDTFSQPGQYVWSRYLDDPPTDEGDPSYWHPDDAGGNGPWASAKWKLVHAYFAPTGPLNILLQNAGEYPTCRDEENPTDTETVQNWRILFYGVQDTFFAGTDYDAVLDPSYCY